MFKKAAMSKIWEVGYSEYPCVHSETTREQFRSGLKVVKSFARSIKDEAQEDLPKGGRRLKHRFVFTVMISGPVFSFRDTVPWPLRSFAHAVPGSSYGIGHVPWLDGLQVLLVIV